MKPKTAELLLFLYFLLPVGSINARPLVALTLLSQIKAIYLAWQAEKKLDAEDDDGATEDFFRTLCLTPSNTLAYAYLGIFRRCPVFLSHQNGDRITSSDFTLIGQTSPNETVQLKIISSLPLLGGLLGIANEPLVEQEVIADDNGRFQFQVSDPSGLPRGARYTVYANVNSDTAPSEPTQITLVQ